MTMQEERWRRVEVALHTAKAIAWDGCHKIYVLMDDGQVKQMREYDYDPLITIRDPKEALETVRGWWDESCGLRFVSAVKTVDGDTDANEGFMSLIGQFEGDDEDEEEG